MTTSNTDESKHQAFTLIELLVVVAIIALLISILLPSLNRAKRQARQLVCTTNLRSQGQAAVLYAEDNESYLPRAIQGEGQTFEVEYHIYATAILKYLGWTGNLAMKLRPNKIVDVVGDPDVLWGGRRVKGWVNPMGQNDWWRGVDLVLASIDQFQCPDYPQGVELDTDQWERIPDNPLDYVASAFPIPYMQVNMNADGSNLVWEDDSDFHGEGVGKGYKWATKIEDIPAPGTNAADFIYVTEAHTALPWKGAGPRYHHVFLASQLPFSRYSRMANDERHPAGLCNLFFDGHVKPLDLHELDCGYPNTRDKRLKYFTVMPDWWEPTP